MVISYAVTVSNEFIEIQRLLAFLLKHKQDQDEIVVLVDLTKNELEALAKGEVYQPPKSKKEQDAEAAQESFNKTLSETLYQYDLERVTIQSNLDLALKKAELEGKSLKDINELRKQAALDTIAVIDKETNALNALRITRQKEISATIKDEKERKAAITKLNEDIAKEGRRLGIEKFKLEQQILLDEVDLQIQLKNSVNKTTDAKKEYIQTILDEISANAKLLIQNVQLNELDATIVSNLEKKVEEAKNYANELNKLKTFAQLYKEELEELNPVQDNLGDIFTYVKGTGENLIDSLDDMVYTAEQAKEAIKDFDDGIEILSRGLNETDKQLLFDFSNNYKELFNTFQRLQQFKGKPLGFDIASFQKAVTDVNLLTGKITEDPYSKLDDITKRRTAEQLAADKLTARQRLETLKKSFTDEFVLYLEDQERKKGLTDKQIADNRKTNEDIAASTFDSPWIVFFHYWNVLARCLRHLGLCFINDCLGFLNCCNLGHLFSRCSFTFSGISSVSQRTTNSRSLAILKRRSSVNPSTLNRLLRKSCCPWPRISFCSIYRSLDDESARRVFQEFCMYLAIFVFDDILIHLYFHSKSYM